MRSTLKVFDEKLLYKQSGERGGGPKNNYSFVQETNINGLVYNTRHLHHVYRSRADCCSLFKVYSTTSTDIQTNHFYRQLFENQNTTLAYSWSNKTDKENNNRRSLKVEWKPTTNSWNIILNNRKKPPVSLLECRTKLF